MNNFLNQVGYAQQYNQDARSGLPVYGSDDFAARTRAYLNREIYRDTKERFQPFEDELLDAVQGEELLNEQLERIRDNFTRSGRASADSAKRRLSRFGVQQSARQLNATNTQNSLNQASALASAENQTRRHVLDRNIGLITGSRTRQAIQGA
ncbi:hypothetical protein [Agarilytica rhodophyticola]|uniref:hypothetical protein n=1 Tax=Agarilytica rhodophyticola TaxID=1737490 RepID=UPI000B341F2B|nr:hypothetical protein [Agarilytica rhodophyticola]